MAEPAGLRARVERERERAYSEWQAWARETAEALVQLPQDERMRKLREHQEDLSEEAWYRVAQSLVAASRETDAPKPKSVPAAHDGDTPSPRMHVPPQTPAGPPPHASNTNAQRQPTSERLAPHPHSPDRRAPVDTADGAPKRGRGGQLYDLLVGLVTIGAIAGGLMWLLSGQVN
ncbi:hypothetical protein [Rhodovibrio salinarum]|nr:hypothetical protein [Rhodovibrio salinarum]